MLLRRKQPGVALLACALLGVALWVTEGFCAAHLATSAIASLGGQGSSANFRAKSTQGQSTPIGPSMSTNYEVGAGFWYQDPVAPSAIEDLAAILAITDIHLEWSPAGDNVAIDHYVVYRGTDPDFIPSGGNVIGQTEGASHLDPGAAGMVGTDYYYLVKAEDPRGNLAKESNRVGEFDRQTQNHPK